MQPQVTDGMPMFEALVDEIERPEDVALVTLQQASDQRRSEQIVD